MNVVWAIAKNTFTELVRMKVFYFLVVAALMIIGFAAFLANLMNFSFADQVQMHKDIALGSISIFSSLIAILATANFIPKDLEDRTIYTILAKPVPRFSYLLGKLGGILLLLALTIAVMTGVLLLVLWIREQGDFADARQHLKDASPDDVAKTYNAISGAIFNVNLIPGILIIFMKAVLLASMTLLVSTFATSSLFTTLMSVAIYFIGHMQASAREYLMNGHSIHWGGRVIAILAAILFPDLQAFNLTDDVIAGAAIPLGVFLQTMTLGALYVAVYFFLSALIFSTREL